jgi:DNA-directed RNA polymerase specialized sigma24 family protein
MRTATSSKATPPSLWSNGSATAIAGPKPRLEVQPRLALSAAAQNARPQLVEDFLQETWLVALAKIRNDGLEDPGRLAGYLCGIANNLVLSDARRVDRQRTTVDSDIVDLIPDETSNPFRHLSRAEVAGQVRGLPELSQADREILHCFTSGKRRRRASAPGWVSTAHTSTGCCTAPARG